MSERSQNVCGMGSSQSEVKKASPETQVTVTFQYEDLQGMLPTADKHFADWQLIKSFEDKSDVTAISTYPSFAFARASDIPANYYSQLRGFTDKPIVIAEMGYSSDAGAQGINNGTKEDQDAFLARALADAEQLNMPAVIWFAAWDPAYAQDTSSSVFQHIGLLRAAVHVHEQLPGMHALAAVERQPRHHVADLGGDRHRFARLRGAQGLQAVLPRLRLHPGGGHGGGCVLAGLALVGLAAARHGEHQHERRGQRGRRGKGAFGHHQAMGDANPGF